MRFEPPSAHADGGFFCVNVSKEMQNTFWRSIGMLSYIVEMVRKRHGHFEWMRRRSLQNRVVI